MRVMYGKGMLGRVGSCALLYSSFFRQRADCYLLISDLTYLLLLNQQRRD